MNATPPATTNATALTHIGMSLSATVTWIPRIRRRRCASDTTARRTAARASVFLRLSGTWLQFLVEDDRVMRGSVRIEGISWDRPRGGPTEMPIQVFRGASPLRVQRQEAEPRAPRRVLDGQHQLSAQTRAAAAAMHQQLHDLRAMRLVRCPGRVELDGTDNTFDIDGDE